MTRERLALSFGFDGNLPPNHIRGLASVYNKIIESWMPTRILPGAFTKTLRENAKRIKVLYQHNPDWPIGVPTRMEDTPDGLLVEAKISRTSRGQEALTLIRDGVIDSLSIGFDPIRSEMVDEGGTLGKVRHIQELRLWEFSPVTFPASKDARIAAVNAMHQRPDLSRDAAWVQKQLLDLELAFLDALATSVRVSR